jgi:hyperosmotically inducible periplasmic protein
MPDANAADTAPPRARDDAATKAAPPQARLSAPSVALYDALGDAVMSGRIKAALLADPRMRGADVSVNSQHGVVSLTGTVNSQEQIAIASAHAQSEDGVMRIDNHLTPAPE